MGVGKVILGVHGPSSIVWSENGPCCGTIAHFAGGKRGEDLIHIICLKLYQFERTTWWCLSLLESILKIVMEYALEFVLTFVMLKKIKLNHGLSKFASNPPLGGRPDVNCGRPWNLIHSPPCRSPCRLFHPWSLLWTFRPSPLCVKWTWKVCVLSTNGSS